MGVVGVVMGGGQLDHFWAFSVRPYLFLGADFRVADLLLLRRHLPAGLLELRVDRLLRGLEVLRQRRHRRGRVRRLLCHARLLRPKSSQLALERHGCVRLSLQHGIIKRFGRAGSGRVGSGLIWSGRVGSNLI